MTTHIDMARQMLGEAGSQFAEAGDQEEGGPLELANTSALIGIGHALLALNDTIVNALTDAGSDG